MNPQEVMTDLIHYRVVHFAPMKGKLDYKGFFINFIYGVETAVVLTLLGAAEVVLAPALMNGGISALVTTLNIAKEDFESGNVRGAKEAERLIGREAMYGTVIGAVLGPVDSFLDEVTFLKIPWADSLLKGVMTGATVVDTGIGFRWLETLWMPQSTDAEKRDYIYNQKTMVPEFLQPQE